MKHILNSLSPRLALLGSACACLALVALLALAGPLQIVISIQPLGSPAAAAPALILPTVTPPPPPTEVPPAPTEEPSPPPATSTAAPVPTDVPPTATSTAPPAPTALPTEEPPAEEPPAEEPPAEEPPAEEPPAPTEEPTEVPPAPTEVPPAPTEVPPAPTEVPPAPTEVPPAPTEVPPAPIEVPPAPIEVPPAPIAERRIDRAPDNLPNTADPEQATRFMTSYLPLISLAITIIIMGWLMQRGAFRQRVLVDLSPRASAPQHICLGDIQLDVEQIQARWQAGATVASLVEDLARHNKGVSRVALTLAVQRALHS